MPKTLFAIRLDDKMMEDINEIAKEKKRKKSDLIRFIIENYIDNYKFYMKK